MRVETTDFLQDVHKPVPEQTIWEWARDNVDFSHVPAYETPIKGQYDPDYMPFWKEPAEALTDPEVREVWIWKCSRAGGSENVLLNPIRHAVAVNPQPVLYMSGDQKSVEHFMEKRIKLGLQCADSTREKLARAKSQEHRIYFSDMDLLVGWPRAKTAFKQTGYSLILADEVSIWPVFAADMMRERTGTYPFSHICGISSMDPQPKGDQQRAKKKSFSRDPIMVEFLGGDQRYWFMKEPKGRGWFRFEMGSRELGYGLMWDPKARRDDGTWDMDKVRDTAYYKTPGGSVIRNADRMKTVATGKWRATNPKAPAGRRSYHLNAFHLPFPKGDFGEIAVAFLTAKYKGREHLRIFVFEYLAERWDEEEERIEDDALYERCRKYGKGMKISECETVEIGEKTLKQIYIVKDKATFVTVDVQKVDQWVVCREWIDGGDSGMIDFARLDSWEQIEEKADKYGAIRVGVDYGYEKRRMEVFEYCLMRGAWPMLGRDNLGLPFKKMIIDPFEGKQGQTKGENAQNLLVYHFNTDVFGTILLDMMDGESDRAWYLPKLIEREYVRQAASMERVEGVWQTKQGHPQNHLWDCEVMQLVLATVHQLYRHDWA